MGARDEKEEDTGRVGVLREGEEMGVSLLLLPHSLNSLLTLVLLAILQCCCLILPRDLCMSYSSGLDYLLLWSSGLACHHHSVLISLLVPPPLLPLLLFFSLICISPKDLLFSDMHIRVSLGVTCTELSGFVVP